MTKLEEKLIELGYENIYVNGRWYKEYDGNKSIFINTDEHHKKIKDYHIHFYSFIECQQDIDNLQLAFNEMQKDLEILKECEK
jgi:hypothetical protein